MLCAECDNSIGVTLGEDFLCDECRCTVDGVRKCEFVNKRWKCKNRYDDDGNKYCPSCRVKEFCEYCGEVYTPPKYAHRFKGLCDDCRRIASKAAPLKDEHVVGECAECGYEAYSACCDALVYATIV